MILAGAFVKFGDASPLIEAIGYVSNYAPKLTDLISEVVTYAPNTMIVLGMFLAVASFCGCCGAINTGNCLMNAYSTFVLCILGVEIWIVYYALKQGVTIENGAANLVTGVWDKNCRCLDGTNCVPSSTECFDPAIKIECMCTPCKNFLLTSLCHDSEFAAVDSCSLHVKDLISSKLAFLYEVFGTTITFQVLCLIAACRIASWSSAVAAAEREEESLLAETYKNAKVAFQP